MLTRRVRWLQIGSRDEPVEDNPTLTSFNVESRVNDFVAAALSQANNTRGFNVMWTVRSPPAVAHTCVYG